MDIKVYKKEEVLQPSGTIDLYVPSVIDAIPEISVDAQGNEIIENFQLLDEEDNVLEQECALATIWQRGLDPLAIEDGISWSQLMLGEISALQVMEEITSAVSNITLAIEVEFDTITDAKGNSFLSYRLKSIA